jgi:hypothetical protein
MSGGADPTKYFSLFDKPLSRVVQSNSHTLTISQNLVTRQDGSPVMELRFRIKSLRRTLTLTKDDRYGPFHPRHSNDG